MRRMIKIVAGALLACAVIVASASGALAKVQVVSSTLDMADFAREIGGEHVTVHALSMGKVDLHFFEPRPSHVMKLKKADLLIVGGMDLDIWIQALIDASRNSKVRFGRSGYVDPSDGIAPLNVPQGRIDGSMGDLHPYGNPHFWYTPQNVNIAVENICRGLCRVDPAHEAYYRERKNDFLLRINSTYDRLIAAMKPYRGTKVLQFHQSWDYFCNTFGLDIIGELEPKPGITPSPSHLKEIVELAKWEGAELLLAEPYYPQGPIDFVRRNTGARVLRLPNYLGSKAGIGSYLENLEYNVNTIVEALAN